MTHKLLTRDKEIVNRFQAGESIGILALSYSITRQRVSKIIHKAGIRLERRRPINLRHKVTIPDNLLAAIKADKMTVAMLAKQLKCSKVWVRQLLYKAGVSLAHLRSTRVAKLNAQIYEEFMSGAMMLALAAKYQMSRGVVGQRLVRHRETTGDPPKSEWYCGRNHTVRLSTTSK